MGREAHAEAAWGERKGKGRLLLEGDTLVFRGEFRLRIALKEVTEVAAGNGLLRVAWGGEQATFDLGDEAEAWAHRVRNPKPLLDKLGVRPGTRVVVLGVRDEAFLEELGERTTDVAERLGRGADADVVFFLAETRKRLEKLPDLARAIRQDGAVWVVHPKGRADLRDVDVIAAGKAAGLVDNKVVGFSATHSALRFVVPLARRAKPPGRT